MPARRTDTANQKTEGKDDMLMMKLIDLMTPVLPLDIATNFLLSMLDRAEAGEATPLLMPENIEMDAAGRVTAIHQADDADPTFCSLDCQKQLYQMDQAAARAFTLSGDELLYSVALLFYFSVTNQLPPPPKPGASAIACFRDMPELLPALTALSGADPRQRSAGIALARQTLAPGGAPVAEAPVTEVPAAERPRYLALQLEDAVQLLAPITPFGQELTIRLLPGTNACRFCLAERDGERAAILDAWQIELAQPFTGGHAYVARKGTLITVDIHDQFRDAVIHSGKHQFPER